MSHSIYLRKDGRWEARLSLGTENGKRKTRSFYGKSREEAEYKLLISQQNLAEEYAVTEMTVRELAVEYLHTSSLRLKESTAANYRMKAEKHIIPSFGEIDCGELKSKEVYAFINSKLSEGFSARYISDIIVLLKSVMKYAAHEYGINNVTDGISIPKKNSPQVCLLTDQEQTVLKNHIGSYCDSTSLRAAFNIFIIRYYNSILKTAYREIVK